MSATSNEWLVMIQDRPDVLKTRYASSPSHIANYKPIREQGQLIFAGPMLGAHPQKAGDPLNIVGSVLVLSLDSLEDVWRLLREDPFNKAGVWDLEKTTVTPFKSTVRTPFWSNFRDLLSLASKNE
ncbi:YCII-related domain protein [Metarhizium album ARSEF 1941]|uniref:YCII-related domain protein n=1 Tax=Metarhizium album (strain ARSEF 1941) TaxID=1081103 RepID=A0A0B2WVD4_METAS|nr:YCII-related domain protein [Metarhizium album ARSEF 1941]KHN98033.1 YCII-related domain protein [Metarhizium album ARSEF 1941]